ncbi:hypothetical protein SDC9_86166 [bioreactor metagenome]|uniref:Uncharacterized protein n=1 Tax=bioreactor metagenome TaxID=1076179 RepID=A0A644ZF75_9ZZZZ
MHLHDPVAQHVAAQPDLGKKDAAGFLQRRCRRGTHGGLADQGPKLELPHHLRAVAFEADARGRFAAHHFPAVRQLAHHRADVEKTVDFFIVERRPEMLFDRADVKPAATGEKQSADGYDLTELQTARIRFGQREIQMFHAVSPG